MLSRLGVIQPKWQAGATERIRLVGHEPNYKDRAFDKKRRLGETSPRGGL